LNPDSTSTTTKAIDPIDRNKRRPQQVRQQATPVKAPEEAIAIEAYRGYEGVHKQQEQEIDPKLRSNSTRSDRSKVAIDLKSSFSSKL